MEHGANDRASRFLDKVFFVGKFYRFKMGLQPPGVPRGAIPGWGHMMKYFTWRRLLMTRFSRRFETRDDHVRSFG
jgi:hypothetical protein